MKKAGATLTGETLEGNSSRGAVESAQFLPWEENFEGVTEIHDGSHLPSGGPHPHSNELGVIEENGPRLQPSGLEFYEDDGPDSQIQLIKENKEAQLWPLSFKGHYPNKPHFN